MLHHVSLEIPPGEAERSLEFWRLLGFRQVAEPEPLAGHVSWLERQGTQIHLIHTPEPTVPALGHPAVAVDDFGAALEALRGTGFEVAETRELWGERRAFALAPGGHRVELMAAPPRPAS